jgi:hypothetical protein
MIRSVDERYLAVSHNGRLPGNIERGIHDLGFYPSIRPQVPPKSVQNDPYMTLVARMTWLVNNPAGLLVVNTRRGVVDPQYASDVRLATELQQSGLLPEQHYPIATLYEYEGVRRNDQQVVHTLLAAGAVSLNGSLTNFKAST